VLVGTDGIGNDSSAVSIVGIGVRPVRFVPRMVGYWVRYVWRYGFAPFLLTFATIDYVALGAKV